ncbi:MAG: Mrp/NBP35 family ATP-binding protein [Phycisphaerales bacterium]|nr:Mrp/NBP35 family ATP-binding protein [Phycisphaerales bacterium]
MPLQESDVFEALRGVEDPDLKKDLVSLGMVQQVAIDGDHVTTTIELTTPACPMKDRIKADITAAIAGAATTRGLAEQTVDVVFTAAATPERDVLPGVRHVIAVGAGKGGVGKSTISTLLAIGLSRLGATCGLLDGDIYGPSLGTMLGLDDLDAMAEGNTLVPFPAHGIKSMTIGKLVDPDKPMIWRGPMAHKAFSQLLLQTDWGTLDYLIVDLPPGTGDVPLSLAQAMPLSGAVIVGTPQRVALEDARRAVRMFGELGVPVLGLVENMSWFIADDGREYDLFGRGGGEAMASDMGLPFLGPMPMHIEMRKHADAGTPLANFEICSEITDAIEHMSGELARRVSMSAAQAPTQPTISVS